MTNESYAKNLIKLIFFGLISKCLNKEVADDNEPKFKDSDDNLNKNENLINNFESPNDSNASLKSLTITTPKEIDQKFQTYNESSSIFNAYNRQKPEQASTNNIKIHTIIESSQETSSQKANKLSNVRYV
ncbi:hypothetical protein BpHYR1_041983 [Brachionus plicatilis]|uniref:Uncharacterized protein n=1 Tax=Brachionus plicatilis TaxID=10195 RepID=A0A3M7R3R3_BRAPC|nr:hypothetical protein BpHYR1_041983 [Brachionus plicatilis]